MPRYGRAGVPEVWLIDLAARTVEVFNEPHFTGYGSTRIVRAGDKLAPKAFPDASLDVSALLAQTR